MGRGTDGPTPSSASSSSSLLGEPQELRDRGQLLDTRAGQPLGQEGTGSHCDFQPDPRLVLWKTSSCGAITAVRLCPPGQRAASSTVIN